VPFTDRARIHVEGGRGGDGCLSFRREPHIPRGGPDGGNGGRGGSVLLVADPDLEDLSALRHAVHHRAPSGAHGEGARKDGRAGRDLAIAVPVGTRVSRDGDPIAELGDGGMRVQVARGGNGGVGNRAFRSSTNRTPRQTTRGEGGEATWLTLEFVLPVDVALIGLPNSGKSSLLRALTGARAKVAAYPFTTVEPEFGPVGDEAGARTWLAAELPGLGVDGTPAEQHFLHQIERARVILHCVDATDPRTVEERLIPVRAAIEPWRAEGAVELVVATGADPADTIAAADACVDTEGGAGVDELRDRLTALLEGRR
jgi:GTP-binding protein